VKGQNHTRRRARGEEFGERRLRVCVNELSGLTAEEICARVVRRVDEWCADTPQHDDLTLVVLKVK
jgi:phosphoserine phosphatase RsbU/P